jgi:hypothetical protein
VPPRAWKALLRDVIDRAARIEEYTRGLTFEEFEKDTLRIDAVLYNITIIGEAASQVPPEVQQRLALRVWRWCGKRSRTMFPRSCRSWRRRLRTAPTRPEHYARELTSDGAQAAFP